MTKFNNLQYKESYSGLVESIKRRILVLDGAMGTMIQSFKLNEPDFRGTEFSDWHLPLKGCNDILSITRPEVIKEIHRRYLEAGADIIETNSFNSNAVSLADYGLESYVERLNRSAALTAREAVDEWMKANPTKRCWVAGSIGPTGKSLSMAAGDDDYSSKENAEFNWDTLVKTYIDQTSALIEGGVDILLIETAFDTLNAKAAIFAARRAMERCGVRLPVIISTTLTESGRTLSGQTPEAFVASVAHADAFAIGLNCGFGAEGMMKHLEAIKNIPYPTVAYPNAGLPNVMGEYDETPDSMAEKVRRIISHGLVNIIGGCCGSTPAHISRLARIASEYPPRTVPPRQNKMELSGLEALTVAPERRFLNVGERCNVAGSRKFLRLIKERSMDEAVEIARNQVEAGAQVIDINMDDSMLDALHELPSFLYRIGAEPEVARVPVMIDSSKWDVIEASLKCVQGHPIVNSLSLKEGEEAFIRKASLVKDYGASLIVMAFDEQGQADTFERKIEVCKRAYGILTEKVGFKSADIVFDPNILTVATGIEAHDRYAIDFIRATEWIKANLPGAKVSGGVSNLSFAFRGNNYVREAMHAVFLYHAIKAGMDMAIVNAANLLNVDDIEKPLRDAIEDVILCRRNDATERLVDIAEEIKNSRSGESKASEQNNPSTPLSTEETIKRLVVRGSSEGLENALDAAINDGNTAMSIIDGPLMSGMNHVGRLFGEGKMFLPQVVKSARTMRLAVEWLTPHIEKEKSHTTAAKCKIVMATVKGDVHDIGKNIVEVILNCNGIDIFDMGVMVPGEDIVNKALEVNADFIGLSGLITPSLEEMCEVAKIMERRNMSIPLLVGGATTSAMHTAVKIAPCYSGPVIHTHDAASLPPIIQRYMDPSTRAELIEQNSKTQEELRLKNSRRSDSLSAEDARAMRPRLSYDVRDPNRKGIIDLSLPIDKVREFINWRPFMTAWGLDASLASVAEVGGCDHCRAQWLAATPTEDINKAAQAMQLHKEALRVVDRLADGILRDGIKARVAILPASSTPEDSIVMEYNREEITLPTPRQRSACSEAEERLALSDFIAPRKPDGKPADWIGLFAVTVGNEVDGMARKLHEEGDEYRSLLYQTVAHRLAEAATEYLHLLVRTQLWGYSDESYPGKINLRDLKYEGIRPAVGYPSLPDQKLVFTTGKVLDYQSLGITLTENGALLPSATTTGLIIAHPKSRYFIV